MLLRRLRPAVGTAAPRFRAGAAPAAADQRRPSAATASATFGSYTERVAQRVELVEARRWVLSGLTASGEGDEGDQEPASTAREILAAMKLHLQGQGEDVKRFLAMYEKLGLAQILQMTVSFIPGDDDAKALVKEQLLRLGYEELLRNASEQMAERACKDPPLQSEREGARNISTTRGGSGTAKSTCHLRFAAHALGFGQDHYARLFLTAENQTHQVAEMKTEFSETGLLPGMRMLGGRAKIKAALEAEPWKFLDSLSFLHCRTCFGDDALAQFVEDHSGSACNVVILGAGFDTKFHRMPFPDTARLFEVDAKGTQEQKLKYLAENKDRLPNSDRVHYVCVDFLAECWLERLVASGLCTDDPTLIIWEGVVYYLPQEVAEGTLRLVADGFSGPAAIFFDYFSPQLVEQNAAAMKAAGEPWLFGIEPQDLSQLLSTLGLREVDHLSLARCVQRYMPTLEDGTPVGVGSAHPIFVGAANSKWPQA